MKKIKKYNITLTVILLLLISLVMYLFITITAYHKGRYKMQLSVNAADSVPALLVEAKLFTGDGEIMEIFMPEDPKLISRFGQFDGTDGYIRMPERVQVTWFSYKNNTFYRGNFTLPKDKIETLIKNRTIFYTGMPVGIDLIIKPDNTIKATIDYDKTIGIYNAKPITYNWPWKKDRQTEVDATLASDVIEPVFNKKSNSRYTSIVLDIYNKGYYEINIYKENKKLLQLINNRINDTLPPGIPQQVSIGTTYDSTTGHELKLHINFDIKEITEAYKLLQQTENKYELEINLNDKDSLTSVILSNKTKSQILKRYKTDYRSN